MKLCMNNVLLMFICMISILATSCGYHLKGHGSSLPEHIKNIWVPVFQNESIRYGVEVNITEQIKKEIINFGYKIVNNRSEADAELIGTVTKYHTASERINRSVKTVTIRISVSVDVTFTDLKNNLTLYETKNFVSPSISFDIPDNPQERNIMEEEKISLVVEELADQLIQEIFTGF